MKITLCIDKQDRSSPSSELRQYPIDIGCPLRSIDASFDELSISTDDNNKLVGVIYRRCYVDKYGVLKKLKTEEIQELEIPEIMLFEGANYVYIKEFTNLNMKIEYLTNAEMNKYFASKVEMNTTIKQTYDQIMFAVSTKVEENEIIAKINMSPEEITILANKLGLTANDILNIIAGNEINMTARGISMVSDNWSVDKTGYAIMQAGKIANFILANGKLSSEIRPDYDFTEDDLTKIRNYMMETGTLTAEEIEKYDVTKDGVINSWDYVTIANMIRSGISTDNPGIFEIDTEPNTSNIIKFYDGTGSLAYYIGYWVSKFKNISCDYLDTEEISAGNLDYGSGECSSNGYTTIEFNKTFAGPPNVVATPITSTDGVIALKIDNITETSFQITIGGSNFPNTYIPFNWIAMS